MISENENNSSRPPRRRRKPAAGPQPLHPSQPAEKSPLPPSDEGALPEPDVAASEGVEGTASEHKRPRRRRRRRSKAAHPATVQQAGDAVTGALENGDSDAAPAETPSKRPPARTVTAKPSAAKTTTAKTERAQTARHADSTASKSSKPGKKPVAEKPATDRPPSEKPAAERPARTRTAATKPSTDKPAHGRATTDRSTAGKAATERPATDKPARGKPTTGKTTAARPAAGQTGDRKPADSKAADGRAADRKSPGRKSADSKSAESKSEGKPTKQKLPAKSAEAPEAKARPKAKQPAGPPTGFALMNLSPVMLAALEEAEYVEPTPIQAGLIPRALEGVDLMGQARTGTGKTAAFCIPILERIEQLPQPASPQAIVLLPTRELAVQVRDECVKLSAGRGVRIAAVYGGKPLRQQVEQLRRGAEIVVGTPGRVIDLIQRGALTLSGIRVVVLDEADRMLDIGFRPDIEKILRRCPQARQTLLLSATIPPPVKRLAERYMREPEMVDFSAKDVAVETIDQSYFTVDHDRKFDLLVKLLEREQPRQAIVFCRTKRGTDRVARRLSQIIKGKDVDTIHGDLQQSARDRVMRRFRDGQTEILVATDVVGRGIDVSTISHIINYDIPQFCDDYVHRVGRTGRMGREGVAFTFVTPEEGNELTRIEMRINRLLKHDEVPGFAALAKPQPSEDWEETEEPPEPPAPKPVFGRQVRRIRRAL